jgi:hypothetical protein
MSLTAKVKEYLKEVTNYYKGTSCYLVNTSVGTTSIMENLNNFEKVECVDIKNFISGGLLEKELLICNERISKCILVLSGARVDVVEVRGYDVLLRVDEVLSVEEGDVLAYIVTGKGELRKFKSTRSGYVILIEEVIDKPQGYIIYLVDGEYVREVK